MKNQEEFKVIKILWIMIITCALLLVLMAFIVGCTYNVGLVHTEGTASDVIDTQQTSDPNISATIPLKAL